MRLLKKISFYFIISLVLLISIGVLLLYINKDAVKQRAVAELNKTLAVPVGIGSVDISLKKFPKAAVVFNTVYCQGANSIKGDTLLYAKKAYLEFDIWKIMQSPLTIDAISVEEGLLSIKRFKNAKHNYLIWKETDTAKESSLFSLEGVYLTDMRVNYFQEDINLDVVSFQKTAELNGNFEADGFDFFIKHSGIVQYLKYDGAVYLKNEALKNELKLVSKADNVFIENGMAEADFLQAKYQLQYNETSTFFEASSKADVKLKTLMAKAKQQDWVRNDFGDLTGNASAKFTYKSTENSTQYSVVGMLKEGGYKGANIGVQKISGPYEYTVINGVAGINAPNFTVKYPSGDVTGSMRIQNLDRPSVMASLNADLDLKDWKELLMLDTLQNVSGRLKVTVDFKNQFNSFKSVTPKDLLNAEVNGAIQFSEAGFGFKNSKLNIKKLRGSVELQGKNVRLRELYFVAGSSDVFIDGNLTNAINWAYFKGEKMRVDGRLVAQEIQLEDFIQPGSSASAKAEPYDLTFVNNLETNLTLDVMAFSFYTFSASNISGVLVGRDGLFKGSNIKLNTCNGSLNGSFSLYTASLPYTGSTAFTATEVNIPQLFSSFNNFGQSTLTITHLKGTGSAVVKARAKMNDRLEIDLNTIEATADIRITDGELNDFEPMLALSDYAAIDALKKVRFSTLQNNISIAQGVINIPKMEIKNSVLDLQLVGTHTLENKIDYTIRLQLADVLFNKRKPGKGEFDDFIQEQNPGDDPAIYVKMKGDVGSPTISLDKKAIGASIKQDMKDQKQELKDIFKKEEEKPVKNKTGIQYKWPDEDGG